METLKYGSVCSGIEAATVAWHPLGWGASWFAEIEPFPSAVLHHHYPEVLNLGDMTTIAMKVRSGEVEAPDVLIGGTPCQAFSVAGLRNSLEDDRGQLTISFIHLLDAIDSVRNEPAIAVWENVPGVLNTKDNAFGCFLGGLAGESEPLEPPGGKWTNAGYVLGPKRAVAWRVLDAQYFGVAQRRRRVFVVASARERCCPAEILFEREGVRRDTPPSRETGERVAPTVTNGPPFSRTGNERVECEALVLAHGQANAEIGVERSPALTCNHEAPIVVHGTQDPCTSDIAFAQGRNNGGENVVCFGGDVATQMKVRRLTPIECERLQGFPDGYTNIPWRGKQESPDGPRYKALGNSMAVPVMRWIGARIHQHIKEAEWRR